MKLPVQHSGTIIHKRADKELSTIVSAYRAYIGGGVTQSFHTAPFYASHFDIYCIWFCVSEFFSEDKYILPPQFKTGSGL